MHFKDYFATFYQLDSDLFPGWHASPWLKVGTCFGMCLGLALVIKAIIFLVKPEWYDESRTKKDEPKPILHKGIAQKMKEGIPLSKREKTAVACMQLIFTFIQFMEAILLACGIAGATMALMPIVFNWSLTFATNFVADFTRSGLSVPSTILTGVAYVFAGLAPTGFCLIGFASAIYLAGRMLFLNASKSALSSFDVGVEENDDKQ
jgi:MFS family permease